MHRATPLSRLTPTIPHCAEVDVTGGSFPMSGREALWETSPGSVLGAQPDRSPLPRRVYGSHRILCSKMLGLTSREGARLGTQFGWECQFCAHALGLKEVGLVRAGRVSGHESSKRVQTGEPDLKTPGGIRTRTRMSPRKAAQGPIPSLFLTHLLCSDRLRDDCRHQTVDADALVFGVLR